MRGCVMMRGRVWDGLGMRFDEWLGWDGMGWFWRVWVMKSFGDDWGSFDVQLFSD